MEKQFDAKSISFYLEVPNPDLNGFLFQMFGGLEERMRSRFVRAFDQKKMQVYEFTRVEIIRIKNNSLLNPGVTYYCRVGEGDLKYHISFRLLKSVA